MSQSLVNSVMPKNYILIDFENVQPKNLDLLARHPFGIYVFVGDRQNKLPYDFTDTLLKFKGGAELVKIAGNGPNALDFHIACYIGEFVAREPDAAFYIISRDKGFDPLIRHLKSRKFRVQRVKDVVEIPELKVQSKNTTLDEKINTIVRNLKGQGQSKPRKEKTLMNAVNSYFTPKLDDAELQDILAQLKQRQYIKVRDGRLTYHLPKS